MDAQAPRGALRCFSNMEDPRSNQGRRHALDVVFHEDDGRIRKDHGAENYTRLSRIALNLLKADTSVKASIRQKRKLAGWDHDFLLHLLTPEA